MFADKVFQFGAPESSVILARRLSKPKRKNTESIRFVRVREQEIAVFAKTQEAKSVESISAAKLIEKDSSPLFAPMLQEIWSYLEGPEFAHLEDIATIGQGFSHKGKDDPKLPPNAVRESDQKFDGAIPGFAKWDSSQSIHELPATIFLNLSSDVILSPRYGLENGIPQVILNYAPVSRGPWRLKGLINSDGHPVTSDYVVCRPNDASISLEILWGVINSPVGNAFMFCHLGKRHNLVGRLRQLPIPRPANFDLSPLIEAVREYFSNAKKWEPVAEKSSPTLFDNKERKKTKSPSEDKLRELMLRIDAEVMKLYDLPPELERKLLDVFCGHRRKGVPFKQEDYFPEGFVGLNTAEELLAVKYDWEIHAKKKTDLIEKKVKKKASQNELAELKNLKRMSAARRDLLAPLPLDDLRELHRKLTS